MDKQKNYTLYWKLTIAHSNDFQAGENLNARHA